MHPYLIDTQFAANGLLELIWRDASRLDTLLSAQRSALDKEAAFQGVFRQREMSNTANHWFGLYMDAHGERVGLDKDLEILQARITDTKFSLGSLAGALLQIAKQGISAVHKNIEACPSGRLVHGVEVKSIILSGRNQSLHYETGPTHDPTRNTFDKLNAGLSPELKLDPDCGMNLGFEIVKLLGWQRYDHYVKDMVDLLG